MINNIKRFDTKTVNVCTYTSIRLIYYYIAAYDSRFMWVHKKSCTAKPLTKHESITIIHSIPIMS